MRLRPWLVTALVVGGIVAVFVVAVQKLRAGLGTEGPNGVSVEQADDADGARIVVIRSRFLVETARYRPDGALASRDLKAILEDDADRIGTFRIDIRGNQVIGTERYDFDKHARVRTWTRYGADGDLLCTGSQDEDSGVEAWWDAAGKPIPAKRARQLTDGDDAAFPLDAPAAPAAMHDGANGVSVTNRAGRRDLRAASLFESADFAADGALSWRSMGAVLDGPKGPRLFIVNIDGRNRIVGTFLREIDAKRKRAVDRVYSPDGVLLYVERSEEGKSPVDLTPGGRVLKPAEVSAIVAANADENAVPIPTPVRK